MIRITTNMLEATDLTSVPDNEIGQCLESVHNWEFFTAAMFDIEKQIRENRPLDIESIARSLLTAGIFTGVMLALSTKEVDILEEWVKKYDPDNPVPPMKGGQK